MLNFNQILIKGLSVTIGDRDLVGGGGGGEKEREKKKKKEHQ